MSLSKSPGMFPSNYSINIFKAIFSAPSAQSEAALIPEGDAE